MSLSQDELDRAINLSHLTVSNEKKELFLGQLNDILDQVDTLNALDLDNVEPMSSVVEQTQFKREDVPVKPGDLLLEENAPVWEGNAFRVPKILDR
jgi:aspartyl-tRNA(Asn)/glutamyl-tRNA(Gln) amidotransferase subunit C